MPEPDWEAVAGVASAVIAVASVVGLVALIAVFRQLREARERSRLEIGPYLRVDLAPDTPDGTWTPPDVGARYRFDYADFNPGREESPSALDHWHAHDGLAIAVWVANQQERAGSIAHNILLELEIEVPDPAGRTAPVRVRYDLGVHYLEPRRIVRYEVTRIDPAIPFVRGQVLQVSYSDVYGKRLGFAHGSARFERAGDQLKNSRVVFRNE